MEELAATGRVQVSSILGLFFYRRDMIPNWHGTPYREVYKHYGFQRCWHQYVYDWTYWARVNWGLWQVWHTFKTRIR